jgi:hypothetical protein
MQDQAPYGAYPQGQGAPGYGGYQYDPGAPQYGGFPPGQGGPQYPYGPPPPQKKHRLRKWLLIATATFAGAFAAIIVVVAAVGTAAHNAANPVASHSAAPVANPSNDANAATEAPSSAAPSGPDELVPGQAETIGDSSNATVGTVTVESVTVTTHPADPTYGEAPAHGYYVIVHVKDTADQSYTDGWDVNEFDFYDLEHGSHYQPGNGNAFEALTNAQSNADITSTLAAGETADGWIAFDVPSPHGKIVYAPNVDGQPIAEWKY